jgi:hypothetical protein
LLRQQTARNDKGVEMAKKSKRTTTIVTAAPPTTRTEFNPDYTYVKRDLARIGTLAAFFITVLVVLAFFLR